MKKALLTPIVLLISQSLVQAAPEDAPVTQAQFKQMVQVLKRQVERTGALEKKLGGGATNDGAVDLDAATDLAPSQPKSAMGHRGGGVAPNLKVYFDLNLVLAPGAGGTSRNDLSFRNYHALTFLEFLPDSKFQFSFDLPNLYFYEMDYQLSPKLQFRAGRIWIPFDDMSPHNIFGGRINTSALLFNANTQTFLPTVWAELGVGAKFDILDSSAVSLVSHIYVVNGLDGSGLDPATNTSGNYPNFGSVTTIDNNRNKALGGRLQAKFASGKYGLGGSVYQGRWNNQDATTPHNLTILGLDGQARFGKTELRAGLASMSYGIDADTQGLTSVARGGWYGEAGQKFGAANDWKLLFRGGAIQADDRVIGPGDTMFVGGSLLKRFGPIELSLEHSQDLDDSPGKTNRSFTNLRLVVAL